MRILALALATAMCGCGGYRADVADPVIERVSPETTRPGRGTSVTIHGDNLFLKVRTDVSGGRVTTNAGFTGALGDTQLTSVRWQSNRELRATLPALALGTYDLVVTTPLGRSATLLDAVVVSEDAPVTGSSAVQVVNSSEGETTITNEMSVAVPLPSGLDLNRSVLFFNHTTNNARAGGGMVSGQIDTVDREVVFQRVENESNGVTIRWRVVEVDGATVQRGTRDMPNTGLPETYTIDLEPVDPSRSFALVSLRNSGNNYNWNDWHTTAIADATTLEIARGDSCCGGAGEWQVVALAASTGARVHRGEVAMPIGLLSETVALAGGFEPDSSFALVEQLMSYQEIDPTTVANHVVRARILPSGELRVDREGAAFAQTVVYHLVTWDGLAAQHGEVPFSAGELQREVALDDVVDLAASLTFVPVHLRQGTADYMLDDFIGLAWFTTHLEDGGATLVISRGRAEDRGTATWTVLDLR